MTTQEQADATTEMFPIPAEAKRLERFIGDWAVEGGLTMEGNTLAMSGDWRFTSAAGGRGVQAHLDAQVVGLGLVVEDDLVGFDSETGRFHVYSLMNTGAVHDHPASWADVDTFVMAYEGTQEGKPYREDVTCHFAGDRQVEVHAVEHIDGQLFSSMDVTLRKR